MLNILEVECPGCRLRLPDQNLGLHESYNASWECWQLYGELSGYTLSKGDIAFIHQTAVDAYGAQHTGVNIRSIRTVFSLVGLCLAIEHGYTGRQVQLAHMALAKQKSNWPRIEPPNLISDLTVSDVLQADPGDLRDEMLKVWAESVWKCWEFRHDWVRMLCKPLLKNS